jgi:hypothetical protein
MNEIKEDLSLKDLGQFFGTEQYHKIWLNTTATDGIIYVMENGYSWFITDAVSVIKTTNLKDQEFLSIKLKLTKDNRAQMIITNGNEKILYTQDYTYTNAQREIGLYFIDGVLLLTGEY